MSPRRTSTEERPPRLPGAERREHLLDVAAQLVLDEGIDGVTMEGVAARAGVSKGLGYAYFRNSDELLVALYDREMRALDRRIGAALRDAPTLEGKVRAALASWFDHLYERGEIVGALTQITRAPGPLRDRANERDRASVKTWLEMVEAELEIPRATARPIVAAILSGAGGLLDAWVSRRAHRRDLTAAYTTFVMGGLRALADAQPSPPATS